jgi:hypothetical protein
MITDSLLGSYHRGNETLASAKDVDYIISEVSLSTESIKPFNLYEFVPR